MRYDATTLVGACAPSRFALTLTRSLQVAKCPRSDYLLMALLDGLEKSKSVLGDLTDEDGKQQVLGFAMKVFKSADDKYRSGQADKRAAKGLYAAGYFLAVLKQLALSRPSRRQKVLLLQRQDTGAQAGSLMAPADFDGSDGDDTRKPAYSSTL